MQRLEPSLIFPVMVKKILYLVPIDAFPDITSSAVNNHIRLAGVICSCILTLAKKIFKVSRTLGCFS